MNIDHLNKDELISHTAEIIQSQEQVIDDLQQRVVVLFVIVGLLVIQNLL